MPCYDHQPVIPRSSIWALSAIMLCVQTGVWAQTSALIGADTPIPISQGQPFTLPKPQHTQEHVSYVFQAVAGQTYVVRVDQDGLDFIVTVRSPGGATRSFNSPLLRDEPEFILLENTSAGDYRITVHSEELTAASGVHTITILASSAEIDDPARREAWHLMSEGAAENAAGGRENADSAVRNYEAASEIWGRIGEARRQAQSLYSAAIMRYEFDDWAGAAETAAAAAEIYFGLNEQSLYADALYVRAYSLIEVAGEPDTEDAAGTLGQALELFAESHAIHERLGNLYELALVTNNTGLAYLEKGDFRRAEQSWREAESLFVSLNEWRWELAVRQNLAVISSDEGYAVNAVDMLQDILERLPAGEDPLLESVVHNSLGAAQREAGNFDEALQSYSSALGLARNIDEPSEEAYALRGLGSTYFGLGELDVSEQYFRQAIAVAESVGEGRVFAYSLAYLGNVAFLRREYLDALDLHQRAVAATISAPDRAYRQVFVARDLIALGRFQDAIARANDALDAARAADVRVTQAEAELELGRAELGSGALERAMRSFESALATYDALLLPEGQAEALHGLALAARAEGNLAAAIDYGEDSLQRFESQRERVVAPELRAFYSAARQKFYETQIDLLMADYDASGGQLATRLRDALSVSERARARLTVDLLTEASIDLRRDMPRDLVEREDALYAELAARRYQRDRLLEKPGDPSELGTALDELRDGMTSIENQLNLVETEFRRNSRQYAGLTNAEVLTAEQIQKSLSPGSTLLQYALGERRSFAWVVTNDFVRGVEIADRETIERAARNAFDELRTYDPSASRRQHLDERMEALSDLVLSPVEHLLDPDGARVLVVVDGALQYIPFGVLPVQLEDGRVPFMRAKEVISLPSVSAWTAQRGRFDEQSRAAAIAVFADPVLENTDSRLARADFALNQPTNQSDSLLTRSSVGLTLGRLAATANEARTIADLLPADSRFVAAGFDASRETVLSMDLSRFNFLHFATHGLIDSRYPELSALVLSQYDEQGLPRDGYLRLRDIYNLKLNADLVVLSACQTALGRDIRGEGLIGLTQGFLYAGARSLVTSLWQVPDRSTAELMTRFYGLMFEDGLEPADALRGAQLSLAQERRWSDPYFWGAFIVVGGARL